jgi:hypothetical protein
MNEKLHLHFAIPLCHIDAVQKSSRTQRQRRILKHSKVSDRCSGVSNFALKIFIYGHATSPLHLRESKRFIYLFYRNG